MEKRGCSLVRSMLSWAKRAHSSSLRAAEEKAVSVGSTPLLSSRPEGQLGMPLNLAGTVPVHLGLLKDPLLHPVLQPSELFLQQRDPLPRLDVATLGADFTVVQRLLPVALLSQRHQQDSAFPHQVFEFSRFRARRLPCSPPSRMPKPRRGACFRTTCQRSGRRLTSVLERP